MGDTTWIPGNSRLVGRLALGAALLGATSLTSPALQAAHAATAPSWVITSGKVVHLTLIAGYTSANAGFNFNGAAHGQMTITIPLGDTVDATFTNKAQGAQHDAVVIAYTRTLPSSSASPVFPGAATPAPRFSQGGPASGTGAAEKFSFVAGKAGTYMVICGIAGHALAGMWDTLVVSPTAKSASVTFGAAQTATTSGTAPAPSNPSKWISTSGKVVHLTLIAGYNNANAGFNFDGGAKGQMVVTVPLGARVTATYKNAAPTPHDVLIVPYQKTLPTHSVPAAFAGACFGSPVCNASGSGGSGAGGPPKGGAPGSGGAPGAGGFPRAAQGGTFSFTANKAGTYMIICGYPGHAIAGMWDTFVVSGTSRAASITFK